MKKSFTVEVYVDVEIDDSELDQALKDYRECINSEATIDFIFQQIAYLTAVVGDDFHEGIGENGKDFKAEVTGMEATED